MKTSLIMSAIDLISPATKKATQAQIELEGTLTDTRKAAAATNKTISNISSYEKARDVVSKAEAAHKKYETQLANQRKAMAALSKPTLAQQQQLAALEQKVSDTSLTLRNKSKILDDLGGDLTKAGVDVNNLADAQARLTRQSDKHADSARQQSKQLKELSRAQDEATQAHNDARSKIMEYGGAAVDAGAVAGSAVLAGSGAAAVMNQTSYLGVRSAATDWDENQHRDNNLWTQAFAADTASGGRSAAELQQMQAGAIKSGASGVDESQNAVKTMTKMMTSLKLDSASETIAMYTALKNQGMGNSDIEDVIGRALKNYSGNDIGGFMESISESSARAGEQGLSVDGSASLAIALSKMNMQTGEMSSTLESFAEFGAKTTYSDDDQNILAKVGLTGESKSQMFKEDPQKLLLYLAENTKNMAVGEKQEIYDLATGSGFMTFMNMTPEILTAAFDGKGDASTLKSDFELKTGSAQANIDALMSSFNYLAISIGTPLLDPISRLAGGLASGVKQVADFAAKTPQATGVIIAITGVLVAAKAAMAAKGLLSGLKTIRAGVVNITSAAGGGTGNTTAKNDNRGGKSGKAAKIAGGALAATALYPIVDGIMDSLVGNTDAGKWAKETTIGDLWDGAVNWFNDDEENLVNIESVATIPTPQEFDANRAESLKSESTKTISINLSGEVKGLSPELEAAFLDAVKDNLVSSQVEREGY